MNSTDVIWSSNNGGECHFVKDQKLNWSLTTWKLWERRNCTSGAWSIRREIRLISQKEGHAISNKGWFTEKATAETYDRRKHIQEYYGMWISNSIESPGQVYIDYLGPYHQYWNLYQKLACLQLPSAIYGTLAFSFQTFFSVGWTPSPPILLDCAAIVIGPACEPVSLLNLEWDPEVSIQRRQTLHSEIFSLVFQAWLGTSRRRMTGGADV